MCTICVSAHRSSCFRQPASSPAQRRKKRGRDGPLQAMASRRSSRRVTFSTREYVLGTAQDYDRTSFEVGMESLESEAEEKSPLLNAGAAAAAAAAATTTTTTATTATTTTTTGAGAAGADVMAATATAPTTDNGTWSTSAAAVGVRDSRANFCGIWRRSHGFHWAALLEFSGVDKADIPEQAAKMQSSSVVHLIDHDDASFRLFVHSDDAVSGSTSQDQQFFIGGQPRPNPNSSNATSTLSNMRWAKNNQALVLTSVDAASGDEMTVSRHLASQGTVMVQHYRARCAKSGDTAEAVTIFRRMAQGS